MKFGILGAGNIAGKMATTINKMKDAGLGDVELYAVASRNPEKAEAFAEKNQVQKAYGSYEAMLEDPELDLVYVATPHSHHFEHGKLCVTYGKAALVEKPFTANAAKARELFSLAEEKGVLVTEAIWTRYQPMRQMIVDFISSGIVGEPFTLTANISHPISHNKRLVNPALAGGALLDVGIYTLTFAEMLFGRPDTVQGFCLNNEYGVDKQNSITLTWGGSRMAVLNSGTEARSDQRGIIYCTKGYIIVENITNPQSMTAYDNSYQPIMTIPCPTQLTGYEYEVLETAAALKNGALECPSI
ncbi:MAG: Gfo/Idh/MocA family oxidoreductase, partial [Eubacteriales bacterium]|nr:Gfo/Idh/MocA family oxidoreductase [Eubacteriales bacterium]